jgi:FkbM family methyltransferase
MFRYTPQRTARVVAALRARWGRPRLDRWQVEWFDEHLIELFRLLRPDCVLDVGANTGWYGEVLRALGYSGWIVSVEPVARPFAELERRARLDGRWRAERLALGDRDERGRIGVTRFDVFSSLLKPSDYGRERFPGLAEVVTEEEIDVRRLAACWDELLDGVPCARPFLKLDTQGYDLAVLRGAEPVLERFVGAQVEASLKAVYEGQPSWLETLAYLQAHGFEPTGIFPVMRDSKLQMIEADCLLVRSG